MVHNILEKTQRYILGIEGSQGITSFELSPCKRYLAVCERSTQAICIVYDLNTLKRKRILTSAEIAATEFTSISFATSADKLMRFLVTLTNKCSDGNYRLVVWLWDKQRLVISQVIKVDNAESIPLTVSFNPEDPRVIVVTGINIYRYNKLTNSN